MINVRIVKKDIILIKLTTLFVRKHLVFKVVLNMTVLTLVVNALSGLLYQRIDQHVKVMDSMIISVLTLDRILI